jgi:hypothetical protein
LVKSSQNKDTSLLQLQIYTGFVASLYVQI